MIPNIAETVENFTSLLVSPLMTETEVHRSYSNERETKARLIIEPEGSTDLKIILNYLGR